MRIVADENIPHAREAFGAMGDVRLLPGRAIVREALGNAEALFIRSITRIDNNLIEGSRVKFIGSATAGIDHVDLSAVEANGIEFAHAPGSNAESVAQYVAAALLHIAQRLNWELSGKTIGIVGAGQVGSRVERVARALGLEPVLCDPLLAREKPGSNFRPLEDALQCDVLTLHVPLTQSGEDRTAGLIDDKNIKAMKRGAVLFNTSRGGVVDEIALIRALDRRHLAAVVIDTWNEEPRVFGELLRRAEIATPHIAGYATDAKARGTEMIHRAFCRWIGCGVGWTVADALPPYIGSATLRPGGVQRALAQCVARAYPILRDDGSLRSTLNMSEEQRAIRFDELRRDYPVRREFGTLQIVDSDLNPEAARIAHGLGFTLADEVTSRSRD